MIMKDGEMLSRILKWLESQNPCWLTSETEEMVQDMIDAGLFNEVSVIDNTSHLFEESEDEFEDWARGHGLLIVDNRA